MASRSLDAEGPPDPFILAKARPLTQAEAQPWPYSPEAEVVLSAPELTILATKSLLTDAVGDPTRDEQVDR